MPGYNIDLNKILLFISLVLLSYSLHARQDKPLDKETVLEIIADQQMKNKLINESALAKISEDPSVRKVIEWYEIDPPVYKPDAQVLNIRSVSQLGQISKEDAEKVRAMSVQLGKITNSLNTDHVVSFALFKNLEYLQIKNTDQSFDFSGLNKLRTLDFSYVYDLPEISPTVGHLKNLEYLVMNGVNKVKIIPESIYTLKKLKSFTLTAPDIRDDTLSSSIKNLRDLTYLELYASSLSFPDEIGALTNLRELQIDNIAYIPYEAIYNLPNLQTLGINAGSASNLKGISRMKALKVLNLRSYELPPELGDLKTLEGLIISGYQGMTYPQELARLSKLKALYIGSNSVFTDAPQFIPMLPNLKFLEIRGCNELVTFSLAYKSMKNVEVIQLLYNNKITTVPSNLQHIKERVMIHSH